MSKFATATVSSCQLHIGGFCAVLATAILLPAVSHAAAPDPSLRRSDRVDVRRLGKVSEDERAVLRIEWRAGLARAEETRGVEELLDKLRHLEVNIGEVNRLVRNMPVQKTGLAAPVPVATEAPGSGGFDVRLVIANIAALALVALWWFRRRRPASRSETVPVASPETLPPNASLPAASEPVPAMPVVTLLTTPLASTTAAEASSGVASPASQQSVAEIPAQPADDAGRNERNAPDAAHATTADAVPLATVEPVATAASSPPPAEPPESFRADETMILNFSLEEADPEVVARENAKLQAPRPVAAPTPPPNPHEANVEPTLQLAEIMLSMGLEQGAAQALLEYTEANPRDAVYHWLKLLGIYRSRGLQREFTTTAEKLRQHFNIQAAEWGSKLVAGEAPTLENFARVAEHVQKIWSQPDECTTYLRRLLEDNRDGARAGFPQSVAEEILLLVEILKAEQA